MRQTHSQSANTMTLSVIHFGVYVTTDCEVMLGYKVGMSWHIKMSLAREQTKMHEEAMA